MLHAAYAHHQAGRSAEAEGLCRLILKSQADHSDALHLLGVIELQRGNAPRAAELIGRAIQSDPAEVRYHSSLGATLVALGRPDAAVTALRHAIKIAPNSADAHYNLGCVLKEQGRFDEAAARFRRSLEIRPAFAEALNNLGRASQSQGKLTEAMAAYREALAAKPDFVAAHSNLLLCMGYDPACTPAKAYAESRLWNDRHAAPRAAHQQPHANDRDPARPLRVGYVSPDFRRHSVGYFIEPLLAAHDRREVDVVCYAEVAKPDERTACLQALADDWRSTVGMSDAKVAERIREDRIDILVDLAGHTRGNRLLAFAEKPAPVQVTWLGFGGTTGMTAIDHLLTDSILAPEDEAGHGFTETLVRLPRGFLCYAPDADAPEPNDLPAASNGFVTFGSLNLLAKLRPGVLDIWTRILREVPGSRLLLKSRELRTRHLGAGFLNQFDVRGIEPDRIDLMGHIPSREDHLAAYSRADIALDPFPYNGGTTTCESLWMGVPVLTLKGDRFAGRMGASILSSVGLPELVAESEEEYVEKAVGLAGDLDRLSALRRDLRRRMSASPLCDAPAFARKVEAAYREMWRRWCSGEQQAPSACEG
ncbi:MAG: tetratricopeptide repeat protein [Gammaproteobacteria bacterium]|nr:tetratricopeptide repeat protein [Gammaproteobacteria bacterium]NIX88276.1 tetratricopeptide repeat protein [Gammaproteobacteria bacterium]